MSIEIKTEYFDVVGPGYVHEQHADQNQINLSQTAHKAAGLVWAWLTFCAATITIVTSGSLQKVGGIVLAAAN